MKIQESTQWYTLFSRSNGHSSYCQAKRCEKDHELTRQSRLEMKTTISWHNRTKLSFATKRGYATCELKKCLPQWGRQSAFLLLFKLGRIEDMLELLDRARGLVRVDLYRDSAPVNSTTWEG